MDNRCVCCGEIIPEGRQVCPKCWADVRGAKMDKQKWIPVTERLPEKHGVYIVTTTSGAVTTARFFEERTYPPTHYRPYEWHVGASWSRNRHVTHWMPLPEPPKGE